MEPMDALSVVGSSASIASLAASLPTLRDTIASWRWHRADLTLQEIVAASDIAPGDLIRMATDDEVVADLLGTAFEIGMRTRLEPKRQALGKIVARALVGLHDSTRVSEAELLLKALGPLEDPHVRVLARLHLGNRNGVQDLEQHHVTHDELDEVVHPTVREAVVPTLDRLGLALSSRAKYASPGIFDSGRGDICQITDFGRLMLQFLQLEEGEPLPEDS